MSFEAGHALDEAAKLAALVTAVTCLVSATDALLEIGNDSQLRA